MILCLWCNTEKPNDEFYFRKDGRVQTGCKVCRKSYYAEKMKDPIEHEKQKKRELDWYYNNREYYLDYCKEYYLANHSRIVVRRRKYDKEQWATNLALHERKAKNKAASILRRKDDPEFIKKRRGWIRRANHRRRILLKGARNIENMLTGEEWNAVCERYGYSCLCCSKHIEVSFDMTCDHIIPITKDGLDTLENVQLLCRKCNSKKGTKIIDYRPK